MRISAASHRGMRPTLLPSASRKSASNAGAAIPRAATKANAKTAADADQNDDDVVVVTSDAASSTQRCALAAAGLAASLIMVRRVDCYPSRGGR